MAPSASQVSRQDAEAMYTRAASAELARDFDRAFGLYVKATEHFLHLSRGTPDDTLRALYKAEAAKALERAEKIKAVKQDLRPAVKDDFSEGEQLYVLQKSSLVNQAIFPPWNSPDKLSSPPGQPPLSAEQIERAATWRRHPHPLPQIALSHVLEPDDIVQHIVSDCSVCGAMAIAIDHHRRFGSKMIFSSLFPQDPNGFPTRSCSGIYQVRVLFNGTHRRCPIDIDDHLPIYPDGTLMCVSTGAKGQLWPSLVEKAYMQLAGGYDFIGSDSSTDLHALAGWIPEVLDMKSADFQREKTWERLIRGYIKGNCVATLGTGERISSRNTPVDLLPAHCYAIVGVHGSNDNPRLTIFDPWVQTPSEEEPRASRRKVDLSPEEIYDLFTGLYLSWNPAMFKHQLTFHGLWKRDGPNGSSSSHFRSHLQLSGFENGEEADVWVLLTRHLRSHRSQGEYISLTTHSGSGMVSPGSEVYKKGEYTNSPHALAKITASQADGNLLTLISSYEGERDDVGFTLTVYSNCNASWSHAPQKLPFSKEIEGSFNNKTAGGNHSCPTYYLNHQYHLHVHSRPTNARPASRDTKAALSFTVSTNRHIPVNALLAWSQGGRIYELGHNDLALSSGPYSYGYAHAFGRVPPGEYTLVVSAFEPRHIGKFSVRVECSDRFDIVPIMQEGAGMFTKVVRDEWTGKTAGGSPSSGRYASNPLYELQVPSAAQLRFRLQLTESSAATALNLTVFNAANGTSSTLGRHIATSGPYSDALSGVVVENLALQPGRYLVVPSTYKPGFTGAFKLIMHSTVSGVQLVPVQKGG